MRAGEVLTRIGFVLLSGCSFKASCNTDNNLNMDKAQTFVSNTVEEYTGVKPTKVSCPENVKAKTGAELVCTAEVAGLSAKLTMKQTDSVGTVTLESMTGVVASSRIEEVLEAQIKAQSQKSVDVDCGARVHPSKPGDVVTCDVREEQAAIARVLVTIKDEANNVDFKVVALDDGAAPPPTATPETHGESP